ncbi:MAG TPA: 50S ribosomal protein L11 methyltransferase [Vicinamibacterales bacterium]|nr:50S ribosomal protein L11 methyltransferase [Vicinamibacterales bacterium]
MRTFPGLLVDWPAPPDDDALGRAIAAIDDVHPTAIDDRDAGLRAFFSSSTDRDTAARLLRAHDPSLTIVAVDVPDEAWAERSQASIGAVRVGRIVVAPPWIPRPPDDAETIWIPILPSMGFGTGHHASTRLCLALLQDFDVRGKSALDIGTGSGVLAIAAWCLGSPRVLAIDYDDDALASARENVALNHAEEAVDLRALDLERAPASVQFDVVLANITGAMLRKHAVAIAGLVARHGSAILSGFQTDEADDVARTFADAGLAETARREEETWVALRLTSSPIAPTTD